MNSPVIICLLGPPCSGKSTIAKILKSEFRVVNVGEILRNSTNPIIKDTLARGDYVSAEQFILPIIKSKLEEEPFEPLILDGFPRDQIQLKEYEEEFHAAVVTTYYIHLHCPDHVCISRASIRNRHDDLAIHGRLSKHHQESLSHQQQGKINVAHVNTNREEIEEIYDDIMHLIACAIDENV